MAERDIFVILDVAFDLVPVVFIIPYFLAVGTNGQKSLQVFFPRQGFLELAHPLCQVGLQLQDAQTNLNAGPQFFLVRRLGEVVVGP